MAKNTNATPEPSPSGGATNDTKMQQSDLDEMHADAKDVALYDHRLGALLLNLVRHLGGAHGLTVTPEPKPEPEKEQEPVKDTSKEGEDNAN